MVRLTSPKKRFGDWTQHTDVKLQLRHQFSDNHGGKNIACSETWLIAISISYRR